MRALRLHGHQDVRIDDIPEPQCKPGTIKIQPRFNGLCGSDLHAYFIKDFPPVFFGAPHPLTDEQPPVVFGHEFSGIVLEVGAGVGSFQAGDKVTVNPVLYDEACDSCEQGATNCCRKLGFLGLNGGGGGLSDAVVVKEAMAFKLPDSLDLRLGAMTEPLAVGWHGVQLARNLDRDPEATVLVIGGGPVGCAVVLALVAKGVKKILVSEPAEARAAVLLKIGATLVYDPRVDDVVAKVKESTQGRGADAVFDCAGLEVTFATALAAVRTRGFVVNMSVWSKPIPIHLSGALQFKEVTLLSSVASTPVDFQAVIAALDSGAMNAGPMITKIIGLDDLVPEGLESLHNPKIGHCKILVDLALKK